VSQVASEFQDVPVKQLGKNLEAADTLVALLSSCTDVQTKALLQEHLRSVTAHGGFLDKPKVLSAGHVTPFARYMRPPYPVRENPIRSSRNCFYSCGESVMNARGAGMA